MSNGSDSHLKIPSQELQDRMEAADRTLIQAKFVPTRKLCRNTEGKLTVQLVPPAEQVADSVNMLKIASELSGNSPVMTEEINKVISCIRDGICIGLYLAAQYEKRSGLDVLRQQNANKVLSSAQGLEFNNKGTVSSAVAMFAASAYIFHELSKFKGDKITPITIDFSGVPELSYKTPQVGLMSLVYHFGEYCSSDVHLINNGLEMVKLAILYFQAAMNEIHDKEGSFSFKEPFTEVSFQLEDSDFLVSGFTPIDSSVVIKGEFRKVDFSEIVGNRRAKHQAIRLAMMLCCYDLERKKNPFLELLSFAMTWMGLGLPGTGKSLQIAATATKIEELCDKLDLPFLFWPMPGTVIDPFQGSSGRLMASWMIRLFDSDKIVYGPIDDGENNLESRVRQGVSAGVKEVIGEFLRRTEGASAIIRGNSVIQIFTNLPEVIDPAVLSRVQQRFPIDGAQTFEDFLDQDHLWWRRYGRIGEHFVSMSHKSGYKWLENQAALQNLAELEAKTGSYVVKDTRVNEAIEVAKQSYPVTDHGFFGKLFFEVKQRYPGFTSRDVRNIQSAVDGRILDFDLPHEWYDDPKLFYKLDYDRKVELLREQVSLNMKNLSFAEIRLEETLRYLDTLAGITNVEFERQVGEMVKQFKVQLEAQKRTNRAQAL